MATTINKLYMEIKPGIGVGEVHYGMTEQEVISKLGRPDRVDESEYVEGIGNINRELWYSSRNITFTFDEEDDFRLGVITIMGSSYRLFGKELFGLELEKTKKIVTRESGEIPRFEDWSSEEIPEHICLIYDSLGIMFWFDFGKLEEMQCSYLFESDNETVIWPKPS